ncbi:rap guanine nucleotide exchange factor 4 isoform X4 [Tribolium castaneum]|uniref:rap guanine nucleotide exchange factor 4 isoform X4 n=1 Tax=Tribolium castaneum TaxID=7070 RepID=UPI00046C38D2|nr:PREDICTED: rap guanine nucleotide exchange factor 4 isoform X3 [Tribolium castaneum]|eukprot:XP_008198036.1 PREDICTED: rap guanine nucleotide exchange factor 4 isoform X3 [Tribolium castaneum]
MWNKKGRYRIHPNKKVPVTLCTLGVGATFGESILQDLPRDTTVVTQTTCELLRVEQHDFKLIWEKNKELMNDLVSNCKLKNGFGTAVSGSKGVGMQQPISPPPRRSMSPDQPNPAEPITESPSTIIGRIGWALRTLLLSQNTCLKDRKVSGRLVRRCAPGTELVDWLLGLSSSIHTRAQAAGMWQALLEEGVISHVSKEQPFKDKCFLYRFWQDEEGPTSLPPLEDVATAEEQIQDSLGTLIHRGPDAVLRMILRKQSHERTPDDLETIYEELLHIRALAHLSNSVKRELSSVIVFEAHPRAGTVLFHQGDEGRSWYIIVRGSVDVVIHGKGTVNTLHEGDDFGKLALINDAPRAATIVLRENNCHFLRVDKENFNRILRDVEANTVRLKEHGKDVLILEKINTPTKQIFSSHFKYTVMAGTPQKMLEHLLETRLDGRGTMGGGDNFIITSAQDPFLDDFLLTHIVFIPTHQLIAELDNYYRIDSSNQDKEFVLACKRRVIQFVYRWVTTIRHPVFEDDVAVEFLDDLASELESDCIQWNALQEEASLMHHVMSQLRRYQEDRKAHEGQKWKLPPCGQPISLFSGNETNRTIIMPQDDIIFRVYCADHTYCTLRLPVDTTAETIKIVAAEKLKMRSTDELLLVEVKSNGERVTFKDNDISIPTALSLNGRIFVSPKDHLDALTCLAEQEESTQGIDADIELFSTKELAYYMTLFDWDLFWCVHEYELLYHTFGRHHFGQITANLDVFLRRFNEIQFWVVTEICMTTSLSKRVALLRKFIKLAAYCKEYQNLNAFCAIVMGLSNVAVSRLSLTWEKLPSKFRKLYTEFESLIDPSRNHRAYRVSVGKLQPPVVPFMPLLLKDMTFTHEGNKTSLDGLVNFEKMHMLAQTMRTIRFCRSRHLVLEPPSPKSEGEVKSYISCLRVIDNQRVLTSMSQKLEPRRS